MNELSGEQHGGRAGSWAPALGKIAGYLFVIGYLFWLLGKGGEAEVVADRIYRVIFIDFFGWFLLGLLFFLGLGSEDGGKVALVFGFIFSVIALLVAGWMMWDVSGSLGLAIAWICSAFPWGKRDPEGLFARAILRVIWAFASGFLVLLVGLPFGLDGEDVLTSHRGMTLSWALLYFGGIAAGVLWKERKLEEEQEEMQ